MSDELTSGESDPSDPSEGGISLDTSALTDRVWRVLTFDESVYTEVAADDDQLVPMVILVGSTLLAALGGWLWLVIEFDGLSIGRILLREVLLGSAFVIALWAAWVYLSTLYLRQVHAVEVGFGALARTMAYASAPWGLAVLVFLPALSLGAGVIALAGWAAASRAALRATVVIDVRTATLATAAGFVPLVLVLSLLGHEAGMAPGVFVHAGGVGEYVSRVNFVAFGR